MPRIEVATKEGIRDPDGEATKQEIQDALGLSVESVRIIDVYTIDAKLTAEEEDRIRTELFTDPIIQESSHEGPLVRDFTYLIEVGYRPGVTDSVGKTAAEAVADTIGRHLASGESVYTSRQYAIQGDLTREQVETICGKLLANELVQRWKVVSREDVAQLEHTALLGLPVVSLGEPQTVREYDLNVDDAALMQISANGVLALDLHEMRTIASYYQQQVVSDEREAFGLPSNPTDAELESLAQTWSEHCKHKIFNALIRYTDGNGGAHIIDSLFDTYIRRSTEEISERVDWLLSVFHDNAGVIKFDDDWSLVMKVETHNTPSALDPYGGAITGIVGVNRDPLGTGMGSKLIFNTDTFCFAPPDYSKPLPAPLLHPRRIMKGVHRGVRDGANQSGVPDVNGAIVFDDRYAGKPLVFCGTGGLMPARVCDRPSHEKKANPGDLIVMVGGRIGKDGIHGATFSSEELHESSPAAAVQIGDPITQKKMVDFLLEARDAGLYTCITDNGAGGLSCSVGEMGRYSGGCELHLDRAPLKYPGLAPWEILLSEAQERMTLAVAPGKIDQFMDLAKRRSVEATVLGTFTDSGRFHVLYAGRTIAYVSMDFLHEGVPKMELEAEWTPPRHEEANFPEPSNLMADLKSVLGRLNVCSKERFVRQYDHEVQGGSVLKPFVGVANDGPGDASIVKPVLGSDRGVVVACGICPKYSDIDTYHMMACAIDEAVRNAVCVGAKIGYIAGLDNFCWPDPVQSERTPDGKHKLAQLVRACQALYDYCTAYDVPCISGKDSMKNDFRVGDTKISVPPTVLFSVIGVVEDVRKAVSMDAKRPDDIVYIVGETRDELGGSEYLASKCYIGNSVPQVDAAVARATYEALSRAIEEATVASCHDISDGGLGVALAETAFAGGFGMEIDLRKVPGSLERSDTVLFSETQSRFVVTVAPPKKQQFEATMGNCVFAPIGTVTEQERFDVRGLDGQYVVQTNIRELKEAWQAPLRW
jgi:phosphoribosylformylglycinamidine synthase II